MQAAARWINLAVIPLLIMGAGVHRVYAPATKPFEEFQGTMTVITQGLVWAICFVLLADRWRKPGGETQ